MDKSDGRESHQSSGGLFHSTVAFWVQLHLVNIIPVSCLTTPASWILVSGLLVDLVALGQYVPIFTAVTLPRGDKPDLAMPVFLVVPAHKVSHPCSGLIDAAKAACGPLWAVFQGPEE